MRRLPRLLGLSLTTLLACADDNGASTASQTATNGDGDPSSTEGGEGNSAESSGDGDGDPGDGDGDPGDGDGDGDSGDGDGGTKFDLAQPDSEDGDPVDICKVNEVGDGMTPCEMQAPPDAFVPQAEWSWSGDAGYVHSIVTPLVANLTDDNDDGEIDLCDIPDVVVVVNTGSCASARIYVLDGASGAVHYMLPGPFARASTPAIGDIDDDGLPEIIVQSGAGSCAGDSLSAFEHDGTPKWQNNALGLGGEHAIALADLDNDGDVEIMINHMVVDHLGQLVFAAADTAGVQFRWTTTTAADLDGDNDLEVILGRSAWHDDGSEYYFDNALGAGQPAVGDIDDDGEPEIIVVHGNGFSILEHDGSQKIINQNPTGDSDYRRPATIHDLDGDDLSEFALSSSNHYTAFEGDLTQLWSNNVADLSGLASGTAFDFLGDSVAEAIYGDESKLWVFDGQTGAQLLQAPRGSITIVEYPVVSDVDNDGSAEIIVVSNHANNQPTVQVFGEAENRWIQARRIWNQHTYHVTNVREDGTIPQVEAHHWELLNTFRTNAQIEGGAVCDPVG
ncbi:FG-GAP repeat domain-containing protein [Enhygromyxa salina]|nr:VCBS repeat-containing protein [Enhygromyxa salina]